jgi:ADP-heptose:LPS heptosyltransferase
MLLSDFEFSPVILTGPGENSVAGRLAELMAPVKPLFLNIERLGLLGAVLERAGLHIGNDNGPKHIAVACGAPTFTVYGPHSPVSWTYPDSGRHGFITPAEADPGCKKENHKCGPDCIIKITVNAVIEKLRIFINNLKLVSQTLEKK